MRGLGGMLLSLSHPRSYQVARGLSLSVCVGTHADVCAGGVERIHCNPGCISREKEVADGEGNVL